MPMKSWVVGLAMLLAACTGGQTVTPGPSASAVQSARQEIAGLEAVEQDRTAAENQAMTRRAWQRARPAILEMCRQFQTPDCDYTLVWSDEDTPNAFADGEKIYMFNGLIKFLENEAQVAQVVAHEAAHNVAGHPSQGARNTAIGAVAGAVLGGLLGAAIDDGFAAEGVAIGAGLGGTVGRLSYSKEYEREADYVGAYITARAGYDLDEARGLYRQLGALSGGARTTSIFDSHPASPDRLAGFDIAAEEIRSGNTWPRLRG